MKNCLLVDDDLDDQEIFRMCLKKVSPEVNFRALNNGVEAIALLSSDSSYTPDYIFLDVNMPKMNGLACLQEIKQIERLNNAIIYMYSTTSEKSAVQESKRLGAADFIIKPAKSAELKEQLSKIFEIVTDLKNQIHN